jgi:hypothetical protein
MTEWQKNSHVTNVFLIRIEIKHLFLSYYFSLFLASFMVCFLRKFAYSKCVTKSVRHLCLNTCKCKKRFDLKLDLWLKRAKPPFFPFFILIL